MAVPSNLQSLLTAHAFLQRVLSNLERDAKKRKLSRAERLVWQETERAYLNVSEARAALARAALDAEARAARDA